MRNPVSSSNRIPIAQMAMIAAVLCLLGCQASTEKVYSEPDDPDAQYCISQCNVNKTDCRKNRTDEYRICKERRKYYQRQYELCVKSGNAFCEPVDRCPQPAVRQCTVQYDQCFNACGGIIETQQREQ